MANMDEIRKLYDQQQRISIDYARVNREVTARTVRLVDKINERGTVIYSNLDESNADETIRTEIAYFKKLQIADDFEWKYFDYDQPADLKDRLIKHGFVAQDPDAVLILDLQAVPPVLLEAIPQDVRRITDPALLSDIIAVHKGVWDEDQSWLINSLGRTLREKPQELSVYIAYVDGNPASAGWIDYHEGNPFAGLWGGSTLPEYRQRGLYTALVKARVQEAIERGIRYLTIDASPMSRAVLEKFGFALMAYAYECNYGG
ncbi:MAG: GNAT family N-acetyltransferase [Chloroflexota bacterium]